MTLTFPKNSALQVTIVSCRFVKCRDIHFAHQVHREKAPTMAYQYLWGSKALNIANNTVYSQVGSVILNFPAISAPIKQISTR